MLKLTYQEPSDYKCSTYRKQLQVSHLNKGKVFGDHKLETDMDLERRPGEIAVV